MSNMNYDNKWKWNRKRFYLRMKDKEKILDTEYYKGRDIGNIEYVIQNYLNDKGMLPFRFSYEFKFYENKWKVDVYSYNVESSDFVYDYYDSNKEKLLEKYPKCEVVDYGKFWEMNGIWYLGQTTKDYRLYFDTIEYEMFEDDRNLEEWELKELLNIKYNW